MTFLVENFPDLKHLLKFIPTPEPLHPVLPSEVVPMKILFKDEKYKSETIEILSQLLTDARLSGDQQVWNKSRCGGTFIITAKTMTCDPQCMPTHMCQLLFYLALSFYKG